MNWKITKHTFRPLMGQLLSNKEDLVEASTGTNSRKYVLGSEVIVNVLEHSLCENVCAAAAFKEACKAAGAKSPSEQSAKDALAALCQLRGIGVNVCVNVCECVRERDRARERLKSDSTTLRVCFISVCECVCESNSTALLRVWFRLV